MLLSTKLEDNILITNRELTVAMAAFACEIVEMLSEEDLTVQGKTQITKIATEFVTNGTISKSIQKTRERNGQG